MLAKIGGGVAVLVCLTGVESANAFDFSGIYAPANWTLTNSSADGTVDTSGAPSSIALTGGNNGSFDPGTTDYTITASSNDTISYDWIYNTPDSGFDDFVRLLNGTPTNFADTDGQSGTDSFAVSPGDIFGFRIATDDNGFGAGTVTISEAATPVPFEADSTMGIFVLGGIFGASRLRKRLALKG